MSGAMDSHAAVFTRSPQAVEVYRSGTWWRGEVLGWRHDASGTCQMWVRVVVGGVEETSWIDLATLRLPERHLPPAARPSRSDSQVERELPSAQAISALRGRVVHGDAEATAALPMIRDEAPGASVAGAAAEAPTVAVTRPGGRRRAPEDADIQVVAAAEVSVPPGRHRAPRDQGRHRAADTEVFAAVADDQPSTESGEQWSPAESRRAARPLAGAGWSVPAARTARPEESLGRAEVCAGRTDAEPDLLTRPMRLGDLSANSRRPRVGGSLSGV